MQKLLRHANSSVGLSLYSQTVTDIKRTVQNRVTRLVFKSEEGLEER